MKRFRIYAVLAAMLMVTAGVFAKSAKFASGALYYVNGSSNIQLDNASSTTSLLQTTSTGSGPAKIVSSQNGQQYTLGVSTDNGVTVSPVYTTF